MTSEVQSGVTRATRRADAVSRPATCGVERPILSGGFSAIQRVKRPNLGKILDTHEVVFEVLSGAQRVLAQGLKIRVSVVRFRPWPPFESASCADRSADKVPRFPIRFHFVYPKCTRHRKTGT